MIELTQNARIHLDQYFDELRATLRGYPSIDAAEVERDVREHIENSVADLPPPVDTKTLDGILRQLGSPAEWVAGEKPPLKERLRAEARKAWLGGRSWAQSAAARLRSGPGEYRLAFLSVVLLGLAALIFSEDDDNPFALFCALFSFCLARASLATAEAPEQLGPHRWLVYPVLLLAYVPALLIAVLWTLPASFGIVDLLDHWARTDPRVVLPQTPLMLGLTIALMLTALWWAVLGFVGWMWPRAVRAVFYPFADQYTGRGSLVLGLLSLGVFVGCVVLGWTAIGRTVS